MAVSLDGLHVVVTGAGGGLGPAVVEALGAAGAACMRRRGRRWSYRRGRGEALLRGPAGAMGFGARGGGIRHGARGGHYPGRFRGPVEREHGDGLPVLPRGRAEDEPAERSGSAGSPGVLPGGRIVNVGARAAADAEPGKIAYVAAKSALLGMTRALAAEVRGAGILVNAVLPGTIDTPANRAAMPGPMSAKWTPPSAIAADHRLAGQPGERTVTGSLIPV